MGWSRFIDLMSDEGLMTDSLGLIMVRSKQSIPPSPLHSSLQTVCLFNGEAVRCFSLPAVCGLALTMMSSTLRTPPATPTPPNPRAQS
jgi:hypothetical protein